MEITVNERGGITIDGKGTITLAKQPHAIINVKEPIPNLVLCNNTLLEYRTKKEAVITLLPFIGYSKFKRKILKVVLWLIN